MNLHKQIVILCFLFIPAHSLFSQVTNTIGQSRTTKSLNGQWNVIIDPTGIGEWRQVWLEHAPQKNTDFFEYSFEGSTALIVPGDFNSQVCELKYYEGTIWYRKQFNVSLQKDRRQFLHFGAVNYLAEVFLNGKRVGTHEGGFTPFQFEITGYLKEGNNSLIVKVNNARSINGLPGLGYDWLNYGGITRDVNLIEVNSTFIEAYNIQLKKGSLNTVLGWLQLNGQQSEQRIEIEIPELNIRYQSKTNLKGLALLEFNATFKLWTPQNPKRYKVIIRSETDLVVDTIGFNSISVQGSKILLNGENIFLKAVNIHEENPLKGSRAYSKEDAILLLEAAKKLGCNLVRLVHYPHNEHMIKEAEKMGLMVWSELPIYQHISFSDSATTRKMEQMLKEMVRRDRNRCSIIIWSLSNETYPSTPNRNNALIALTKKCREMDSTRLITHVMNSHLYKDNTFHVQDTLYRFADIISINEYIGWYTPWQGKPSDTKWNIAYPDKPVFISEFGGEALQGNDSLPGDQAFNWTETYQARIYSSQIEMFKTIPNLCGVAPWLLFDYRSPGRMHPIYQSGYNRKGLISENGKEKQAWYLMRDYYKRIK